MTLFSTTIRDTESTTGRSSTKKLPTRAFAAFALGVAGMIGAAACSGDPARTPSAEGGGNASGAARPPVVRDRMTLPAPAQPPVVRDHTALPAPAVVHHCVQTCSQAADCTEPGAPALFDASHFACTNSRCSYTGCKSTSECTAANGAGWVCEAPPGASQNDCVRTCSTPADCAPPGAPALFDASHFACTAQRCEFTGCRSDSECAAANGAGSVCQAVPGTSMKDCVASCSTSADCADPSAPAVVDANHFACVANRCEYTGCKSTSECTAANGSGWVCE